MKTALLALTAFAICVSSASSLRRGSPLAPSSAPPIHSTKTVFLDSENTAFLDSCGSGGTSVAAVGSGYPVSSSTVYNLNCNSYRLDSPIIGPSNSYCDSWSARLNDKNQWIQVTSFSPKCWTGVTTQGRGDYNQWVTKYTVQSSLDGSNWYFVDNAKVFNGNTDRTTKVSQNFSQPVYARSIRIYPHEWVGWTSLRFEAYFSE